MATRLIGTDSANPRLPDVVIAASVGTTAADLASGDMFTNLDLRVSALEEGGVIIIPPTTGTVIAANCVHAHTVEEPPLTVGGGDVYAVVPANSTHAHTAESPVLLPDGPVELTLTPGATTFTPWVELQAGSTATVTWRNTAGTTLATGLKPTISSIPANKIIRMFVTDGGLPAMNEVDYLNLGFDHNQDAGEDNIGPAYNHPGQPVLNIAGIQLLTGMRYFMAANTPCATSLNLTGMSNLLHVECFGSDLTSLDLTGCTSMIRVCVEATAVEYLNFSSCKDTLRDIRCANGNPANPVFFESDGPLTELYHYCVRNEIFSQHLTMAQLPAVVQWWTSSSGITHIDPPISPVLTSVFSEGNYIDTASLDAFLIALVANGPTSNPFGQLDLPDCYPPTTASNTARTTLTSRGWLPNLPLPGTLGGDGTNGTWTTPTHQPWVLANLTYEGGASVTGGVLTTTTNGYQKCFMRPGGRNTGDVFFEVMVDRAQINGSAGTDWWAMMTNCNAQGNGGLRVFIHWPQTDPGNAGGLQIGLSQNWFTNTGTHGSVSRIAANPAGWTNAGNHKVGLYHGGDTMYIVLDGVKVYKARGHSTDVYQQGGYVGIVGDSHGNNRVFQSWGIADVTL